MTKFTRNQPRMYFYQQRPDNSHDQDFSLQLRCKACTVTEFFPSSEEAGLPPGMRQMC